MKDKLYMRLQKNYSDTPFMDTKKYMNCLRKKLKIKEAPRNRRTQENYLPKSGRQNKNKAIDTSKHRK